jgi:dTDP-4-dehydrorhamnose 3,5-epimerase-like enzyme
LEQITGDAGTMYLAGLSGRPGPPIARFFFLTGVPAGMRRGGHAHKDQAEYLICVQGSLDVLVESGGKVDVIPLARPGRALYLPPGYWRDLENFSADAVLAVLATHAFSEDDYIRDRDDFRRWEASRRA